MKLLLLLIFASTPALAQTTRDAPLDRPAAELALKDASATTAAQALVKSIGLDVFLDAAALRAAKFDLEQNIRLSLKDASTKDAIEAFVAALRTHDRRPTYTVEEGVVIITSPQGLQSYRRLRESIRHFEKDTGLGKKVAELRFEQVPVKDLFDFLRDLTGMGFTIDWAALKEAGVDEDAHITFALRDKTAGQALALILTQLGLTKPLTIKLDGKLIISADKENPKK